MNYAISVIVPVYNVRNYIARCAESLMAQTLESVEFIFVDDCTSDDSIGILNQVVARYPQRNIRILRHDVNRGLPAARNTGLAYASGEYIYHCDSDDYVEPSMLKEMYEYAVANNLDIVWSDWYMSLTKCDRYMETPNFSSCEDAIRAMLSGSMKYNVWNKVAKRKLYTENGISFPSGYGMGEDLTMIKLFTCAKNVGRIPKAYYHYNKTNTASFSQTYSDLHLLELRHNIDDLTSYILGKFGCVYKLEISFLKLEAKFPFLLSPDRRKVKIWKEWYPEANVFIKQNKFITAKNRLLQLCAKNNYWFLVNVYNYLFNKFIYVYIYR